MPRFRDRATVGSVLLALVAAGFIAWRFSWFVWAEDTCLDAGGAFRNRVCQHESGSYIMDRTPPTRAAWLITVLVAFVPAVIVFALT